MIIDKSVDTRFAKVSINLNIFYIDYLELEAEIHNIDLDTYFDLVFNELLSMKVQQASAFKQKK